MDRVAVTMLDADIYVKTDAGRDEIRSRTLGLPMAVRAILLMVDGQRTVGAVRAIVSGSKAPGDTLELLESQGLIEPRDGPVTAPRPAPTARPAPVAQPRPAAVAAPLPVPPPAAPSVAPATRDVVDELPSETVLRSIAASQDLDLVLPTIFAPEASSVPTPWVTPESGSPVAAGQAPVAPVANRYERLYTMINEVVRDFLPAHRRLFLQLKIERCRTAEDLLEMLHDLRAALAKARGDAFAADVVARLRNAT